MIGQALNHCGRSVSFYLRNKIPVKHKKAYRTMQTMLLLRNTLSPSNKPPQPLTQYPIKILNINRLNIINHRITENYSLLFPNEPPPFIPNLHKLTIIHTFNPKISWKNIHVVVVAVSENLQLFTFLWDSQFGAKVT